jgi:hypothetical protein
MYFRLFLFLAVSVTIFSCTSKSNGVPSVVLMSQPIHDATPDGPVVGAINIGNVVYYLGEISPDSISMKIEFGGIVGWVSAVAVVVKSDAAIIAHGGQVYITPDNATAAASLPPGTLVAVDSVVNERSHIFFSETYGEFGEGWIATADLTYNPDEIAFAIELADISDHSKVNRSKRYEQLFPQHLGSPLIGEVNIDLSEIPDEAISDLQNSYPVVIDKASGKLLTVRSVMESEVMAYGQDILGGPVQYSFAAIMPRSIYYQRYITQLPSFVGQASISDYAQYIDRLGDEQSWRAYLLYRVDRSPQNIRRLYDAYGGIVRKVAANYPIGHNIKALMIAYEHIRTIPNYKKVCSDVSAKVTKWDKDHEVEGGYTEGGNILERQQSVYDRIMTPAITESWDVTSAVWYHSFWVRRLQEGNAEIVYSILQDLGTINYPESGEEGEGFYDEVADEPEESFDDPFEPPTTTICAFKDYSVGDCGHIEFDCGDYGDADASQLNEEDAKLWASLFISDGDGERGNPEMIGKHFEITEREVAGDICNEDGSSQGRVPMILAFKRLD